MDNIVNVNLETDVVTGETVQHFVTSILEFLLYQRNQIPFVWKTFKYLIYKWKNNENDDDASSSNFQLERQKDLARQTLDGIKLMGEVIRRGFQQSGISRVRFLFGSTALLPLEAYTIVIPPISKIHSYEHHKLKTAALNQALISLLTSDCLYDTFSRNLCPMNVFLQVEMPDHNATRWEHVFSTDSCELPSSCKHTTINLVHVLPPDYVNTKCCREMMVFEDFNNLSVEMDNDISEKMDDETDSSVQLGWWEASIIVRGFKQTTVKGNNIWQ